MLWHKMTPFPTQYCLTTPLELEKWGKKNRASLPKLEEANLGGVIGAGAFIFVLVKDTQKHWDVVDTIIHESVHVFQKAMEYCQEGGVGPEAQAYYIASIATNLLKDFDRARSVKEN